MKKIRIVFVAFISIIMVGLYFIRISDLNNMVSEKNFSFKIPKIPSLEGPKIKHSNVAGNFTIWGIKKKENSFNYNTGLKTKNEVKKESFEFKIIKGIPSLCDVLNNKYRWEFYGTVYKHNILEAIFYNPFLKNKGWKLVKKNEKLDKHLLVAEIYGDSVEVKYQRRSGEEKVFKMSIFLNKNL